MKKVIALLSVLAVLSIVLASCGGGGGEGGEGASPAAKTSVKLARTGQVLSYATGSIGDDGALQTGVAWPNPRFTVASSGTGTVVSDNLTGLMWLQDANCAYTIAYDPDSSGDGSVTWQHALDFVKGINNGTYSSCGAGHADWRLPNRKELRSLLDYSRYSPPLPTGHPFSNVQTAFYWTSSTYAVDTSYAWNVFMFDGGVLYDHKYATLYVWPVRSGP